MLAPRSSLCSFVSALTLAALVSVALVVSMTGTATAEPVAAGYRDFSYGASVSAPTGQKPQSKLWVNDGSWWGDMWNKATHSWEIYRFDAGSQTWATTGTQLDPRRTSQADTMWNGRNLYVVSAQRVGTTTKDLRVQLFRYSYSSSTKKYTLDGGFPVSVGSTAPEAVVFDQDSTGRLWITYTDSNSNGSRSVFVAHSTTDDATWSLPYVLPTSNASSVDDISTLVSYGSSGSGRYIGVLYSNQADSTLNFAVHADGDADTAWTRTVVAGGPKIPDDHLNIKSLMSDDSGRVFAAVKTSLNDKSPKVPSDPLIVLWVRAPSGTWTGSTVWTVGDDITRANVVLDSEHRVAYVAGAAPCCSGGTVYIKSSPYDALNFPSGIGTPFIKSDLDVNINNVTTTKQEVNSSTGLLVEAGDDHTRFYLHGWYPLDGSDLPDTTPPDTTITSGPSGTVSDTSATFSFASTESGSTFACSLDSGAFANCTSPASYSGLADGSHTFTVRATDVAGNTDPTPATATWTISTVVADTTPPDTTITSGPSGTVSDTSATFSFASTESGSTFACSLDSGAFANCTSPASYSGLADGSHTFTVRATDVAGNTDPTPATATWTISTVVADTTPPDTTITSGPSGTVSDTSATFSFASTESGSTFACSLDSGAFANCTSPASYSGLADGSHTFTVRATDVAGNTDPTPATATWTISTVVADTTPPDTTITSGPSGTVSDTSATFSFASTESGSTFACSLDSGAFANCTSPASYSGLADGSHTFTVRATDTAANTDPTPATAAWTIDTTTPDTTPPNTTIDQGPSGTVSDSTASFSFSATEAGSTFECSLDGVAFATCTSPTSYSGLADGSHTFRVRATDAAANTDPTPASRTWTVDTTPPDTTPPDTAILTGPSGTVSDATATFSFSATEAGSTFECSLDGAAFTTCTSPTSYSGLADGSHTFRVRATDAAANTDPTPASRTWTVDTTPPDTAILTGPSGTVSDATATFSFSATEAGSTFECSLDGAAFTTCTSPTSYSGLADGSHTFRVRATDAAANTDPTPASRTWTVSTAPVAGITRQSTSTTANTTASTTLSVATPAGTTAGDVLVACLALNGSKPTATGVPAGWTEVAAMTSISNPHVFGYYHVAGTSEPASYQWTLASSVAAGAGIARYSGVDTTTPLDTNVSTASGAAATTATLPGVTTASPGAMLVGCMGANSSVTTLTITGPAGLTQAWDIAGKRHEFDDGLRPTAGATGNQTWTFNASREWAGWLTALKPA